MNYKYIYTCWKFQSGSLIRSSLLSQMLSKLNWLHLQCCTKLWIDFWLSVPDCHSENEIKARDPIRCRECGYRIMYKKRTKRSILWFMAGPDCYSVRDSAVVIVVVNDNCGWCFCTVLYICSVCLCSLVNRLWALKYFFGCVFRNQSMFQWQLIMLPEFCSKFFIWWCPLVKKVIPHRFKIFVPLLHFSL